MSSILTALKKLENDEQQKQEDIRSLSRAVHEKKLKAQNASNILQTIKKSALILMLIVLFVGVGFSGFEFFSRGKTLSPPNKIKYSPDAKTISATGNQHLSPYAKADEKKDEIKIKSSKTESQPKQAKTEQLMAISKAGLLNEADHYQPEKFIPARDKSDSILKLQAIAWSDDPKSRIAVIDGQIVREGETISGALVMRIDENEVVIEENGQELRLIFKLQ